MGELLCDFCKESFTSGFGARQLFDALDMTICPKCLRRAITWAIKGANKNG